MQKMLIDDGKLLQRIFPSDYKKQKKMYQLIYQEEGNRIFFTKLSTAEAGIENPHGAAQRILAID